MRRQRAASGTVASAIGCNHQLQGEAELRQEQEEVCSCQPDSDYDLVSTGLIDPRALPSGRIVNTQTVVCPPGYKNVTLIEPCGCGFYDDYIQLTVTLCL